MGNAHRNLDQPMKPEKLPQTLGNVCKSFRLEVPTKKGLDSVAMGNAHRNLDQPMKPERLPQTLGNVCKSFRLEMPMKKA